MWTTWQKSCVSVSAKAKASSSGKWSIFSSCSNSGLTFNERSFHFLFWESTRTKCINWRIEFYILNILCCSYNQETMEGDSHANFTSRHTQHARIKSIFKMSIIRKRSYSFTWLVRRNLSWEWKIIQKIWIHFAENCP